ncbi:hypothetical protein [Halocatena halophila]|uniref:hypothetical protein n=1 Tax=Halocatena halophila TaxID=2814576 RepID=UPI002ED3A265
MYFLYAFLVWAGEVDDVVLPSALFAVPVDIRGFPVFSVFLFAVGVVGPIWMGLDSIVALPRPIYDLFGAIVGIGFACLPLSVFITVFNRPQFLIPPAHRTNAGKIYSWWIGSNSSSFSSDFTNEDVQRWLSNDPDRLDRLVSELETGTAQLLTADNGTATVAVSDEWWFEIGSNLGSVVNTSEKALDEITNTSAYQDHAERARLLPEVPSYQYRTTPLIVEYRKLWGSNPFKHIDEVDAHDRFLGLLNRMPVISKLW